MEKFQNPLKPVHYKIVTIGALLLIIGVGIFLRFYQIGELSFWLDESFTAMRTKGSFSHLMQEIVKYKNMSFYYLLAYLWYHIFSEPSEGTLRALSAIFSSASIPVVYLLGKTLVSDKKVAEGIGLLSALFVAINSFHVQYAQEYRSYSLVFLLSTLSSVMLIKIFEEGEKKGRLMVFYSILIAASVYSHLFAFFIILSQVLTISLLIFKWQMYQRKIKQLFFCLIVVFIISLPLMISFVDKEPGGERWISNPDFLTIKKFFVTLSGYPGELLIILFSALAIVGFLFAGGYFFRVDFFSKWKKILVALSFLIPFLTAIIFTFTITPIFIDRYLIIIMPYLLVLSAAGISAIFHINWLNKTPRYLFPIIVVSLLVLLVTLSVKGLLNYYNNFKKEDWRNAALYLDSECSDSLVLYHPDTAKNPMYYYNTNLNPDDFGLSKKIVTGILNSSFSPDSLAEYDQVCMVFTHLSVGKRSAQADTIRDFVQQEYPQESTYKVPGVIIEIYSQSAE